MLLRFCDARLLTPQRVVPMSPEEEFFSCGQTWRAWGRSIWNAAFAEKAWLKGIVLYVEGFLRSREDLVLAFSDQLPFWVKVGMERGVYLRDEWGEGVVSSPRSMA